MQPHPLRCLRFSGRARESGARHIKRRVHCLLEGVLMKLRRRLWRAAACKAQTHTYKYTEGRRRSLTHLPPGGKSTGCSVFCVSPESERCVCLSQIAAAYSMHTFCFFNRIRWMVFWRMFARTVTGCLIFSPEHVPRIQTTFGTHPSAVRER